MQNKFGIRISHGVPERHIYHLCSPFDVILGVEKATDCFDFVSMTSTPKVIKVIGWSGDSFFEQKIGWIAAEGYSEVIMAYMDEYPNDPKPEVTAKISSILCQQARDNEFVQRCYDQVTPEEVLNSRYITYPFEQLETCVYSEGAAALILGEKEKARAIAKNMNHIRFAGKDQKVMYRIMSDHIAAQKAYAMAGIQNSLNEIDVVDFMMPSSNS